MKRTVLCLLAIVLPVPMAAQTAEKAADDKAKAVLWTPELTMTYRAVGGVALSPAGDAIAYTVNTAVMEGEKSEYLTHIWVTSANGRRNVQYTHGEKSATSPAFSPDGRYLAFASSRSGKNQIWAMPVDGGEAEQLTNADPGIGSFKWAPDGQRIAYTMADPKSEEEKKAEKEKRDPQVADTEFKFSHIYAIPLAVDADGKRAATRITKGQFTVNSFEWSPDGQRMVFAHQPDPRLDAGEETNISIIDIADGKITPLVTWPGSDNSPMFSRNGSSIAFVSEGGKPEPVGLGDIYIVPVTGGAPRKLADTHDRSASLIGWSHDGTAIYYSESVRTQRHVFALPLNGGAPRQITSGDGVINSPAISRDNNRIAFVFEDPNSAPEVYTSPLPRFAAVKLTAVNDAVVEPPMGRTELVSWRSKDGLEIEGLLTYPVNYQPGRKYPLILNVHGGPAGVFAKSFTGSRSVYMLQYFAQHGYAILRPNPRGSTGYGKDFRFANVKDWGYGDFQDLMSGVDHVINMGVAHPDSLALMGWSYGGYMTSWAVTQTDRFKVASMGAGLSNLVSMVTTTDVGDYLVGHMANEVWDDYETYEKHSAIYHIKNVKTPTQVIHGANDLRVPFTQGQEFYRALQRRGIATQMIVLPRTGHGPSEPKLLMEVSPRIMKWFDQHLRSNPKVTL
jgi:dipeptidyl aminopeptidase/acylaminoacyl peptidase